MEKFEIGKYYKWSEGGFDPIQVLQRTAKTIVVRNASYIWRMKLRTDKDGNEYVVDSNTPKRYRDEFICKATWHGCDMGYKGGGRL